MKRRPAKPADPPSVGVAELKARCLSLIEEVRERGTEYVVTKRGEPVAKLVPIRGGRPTLRGALAGEIEVVGDIVHNDWSAEFEVLSD